MRASVLSPSPVPRPAPDQAFASRVDAARGSVRQAIWRVRCESPIASRWLFNLRPVLRYGGAAALGPEAAGVAATLRARGVALGAAAAMVGPELVAAVTTRCEALAGEVAASAASSTSLKSYLHQLLGRQPELAPDDPLVVFALHPQLRGVAESYSRMVLCLQDVNVWLTPPSDAPAQQSQRWHRDLPEDHDIVKCFFYVRDVSAGAGPLGYVARSNDLAARRNALPTEYDGIGYRIEEHVVDSLVPPEDIVVAEGVAGTVAFADTRGLHRGGYARTNERLVVQITWASAATTRPRVLRPAPGVRRKDLRGVRLVRRRLSRRRGSPAPAAAARHLRPAPTCTRPPHSE